MQYALEVCVDSFKSAVAAADSGADRLELASCLDAGGVSPSYAFVAQVCRRINTCKIHVLVRPRCGDFVYSQDEIDLITADIIQFAGLGAHGIVSGFLHPDGTIDAHLTVKFVELCKALNLDFTFHRAFDVVKDQRTALNSLIDCGVKRILTSGGHSKAFHGLEELSALIQHAEGRVSIMPGGGVDEDNAATILQVTGAKEIHGSFSCPQPSKMQFLHPKVHFSSKKTSFLHRRAGIMHAQSTIHVPEGEEGEERNEYSQEELAEFWGRRVASEEKIKIVKAALEALSSTADVERQMD